MIADAQKLWKAVLAGETPKGIYEDFLEEHNLNRASVETYDVYKEWLLDNLIGKFGIPTIGSASALNWSAARVCQELYNLEKWRAECMAMGATVPQIARFEINAAQWAESRGTTPAEALQYFRHSLARGVNPEHMTDPMFIEQW